MPVFRRIALSAFLAVGAIVLGCAPGFQAAARAQTASPFTVYWCVWGPTEMNPQTKLQIGNVPVNRDIILFNADGLGDYPRAGPHVVHLAPGGKELYIKRHLLKVAAAVKERIPDPNFKGYAAIDWEDWWPFWSLHENTPSTLGSAAADRDYLDDWKDFIRQHRTHLIAGMDPEHQETVFRDTWLEATREYWSRTLQECQRLRPNTKWGVYGLPSARWWAWLSDAEQNPERDLLFRCHSGELSWLFEQVDVHFPSVYIPYQGVAGTPDWQHGRQVPEVQTEEFLRFNMIEAKRIGLGKPIIPFIWPQYADYEPVLRGKWLNDHDLRASFEVPRANGAAGVVFWGYIPLHNHTHTEWQHQLNTRIIPMINMFATGGGGTAPSQYQPPPRVLDPEQPSWWSRALPGTPYVPTQTEHGPAWLRGVPLPPPQNGEARAPESAAGFFSREDVIRALQRAGGR